MNDTYDTLTHYGVKFEGEQGSYVEQDTDMDLHEFSMNRGARITRVRWIGGDWDGTTKRYDLSYVHGVLADGTTVRIADSNLACSWVGRFQRKGALIEWAKSEGVFAKGIDLLNEGVWSTLG